MHHTTLIGALGFFTDSPLLTFIVASIAAVYGLTGRATSSKTRSKEGAAARWPSVPGTVESVSVEEKVSDVIGADHQHQAISYVPHVVYSYVVKGETYTSSRIGYGTYSHALRSASEKVAERYPKGSGVTVYYNPRKPKDAVIERNPGRAAHAVVISQVTLALSAVLLVVGIVQLVA